MFFKHIWTPPWFFPWLSPSRVGACLGHLHRELRGRHGLGHRAVQLAAGGAQRLHHLHITEALSSRDFSMDFSGEMMWNDVKWCEMMWNDVKNVCEDIMWRYVKWCEDVSHNEFQWGLTGFSGWNWWLWKNLKWMGGVKSMAEAMGCQEWILNGWINHWVRLNHRSCIKRQFHSCW